jgi:hypothetical protein
VVEAQSLRLLSIAVGTTQSILGSIFSVLAYLIYASPFIQAIFDVTQREVPLYAFVLLFVGIFLTLSGLLLFSNGNNIEPKGDSY